MRVSVELIPRSAETICDELALLRTHFGDAINVINVPELLRYDLHSWEGAKLARQFYPSAMPHIRAIDIDLDRPLPMADYLREHKIGEVLVIQGDPPQDMTRKIYPTETVDIIWKFKKELPNVKVYAGIDPYRGSMRQEEYRMKRKLQAGADGFFTQPFFDLRYLELYAELLEGKEVYWGVAPVMSQRSVNYWETKNSAIFPKSFEPTLQWNIAFAKTVRRVVAELDASIYFMPIKTNLIPYLTGAFSE